MFAHQAGLEGLAAVVLAVVYVEMGGQAVERAVFRVGHAADERLGDRLRVRVGAKHPAHQAAGRGVVPGRQPRAHRLAGLVQHEAVELMVVAEPDLVHALRLLTQGHEHVVVLPGFHAAAGQRHFVGRDRSGQ